MWGKLGFLAGFEGFLCGGGLRFARHGGAPAALQVAMGTWIGSGNSLGLVRASRRVGENTYLGRGNHELDGERDVTLLMDA